MAFTFEKLTIQDVILIKTDRFDDIRGFFLETYRSSVFKENGIRSDFVQENTSYSKKSVLRGLHYQLSPKAQGKLVRCILGEIFDVAVDIRRGSPTYGTWVSAILSDKNNYQLYIPEDFAHGFCVTSDEAIITYKCTAEYSKEHERAIIWNDPNINIKWPVASPIISEKDSKNPHLHER